MSDRPRLNILHICDLPPRAANANAIRDSIDSFCNYSKHAFYVHSEVPKLVNRLDLSRFDVLMIHYSICVIGDGYADESAKQAIADFKGLKIQFIQDEYRRVNSIIDQMVDLGIDLLFTCVPEGEIEKVYSSNRLPRLTAVTCLTGYVTEDLLKEERPSISSRGIDVSYRSRKPGYWLGSISVEKWKIAEEFEQRACGSGLDMDLSCQEEARIYGRDWIDFVMDSKAMLGVESGASVFDFTGEIQLKVESYERSHPDASFEEVRDLFFREEEGKIRLNVISPRCFEAACLGTAMVLYEGEYSGVLEPWRHYIPLKKDYSNIDEVISILKDDDKLQELADRTYKEIAASGRYSYRAFVETFDEAVDAKYEAMGLKPIERPYSVLEFQWALFRFRVVEVATQYYYFIRFRFGQIPRFRQPSVVIFGAGAGGQHAFRHLRGRVRVLAFCDNDVKKKGTHVFEKPVVTPDDLGGLDFELIWVASLHSGEIYRQLIDMGIPRETVKVAGDDMITAMVLPYPKAVAGAVAFFAILIAATIVLW